MRRARCTTVALVAAVMAIPAAARAASPSQATLTPDANAKGKVTWTGTVSPGTASVGTTDDCFDSDGKPDPLSGCDFFKLTVTTPTGFYGKILGGVQLQVT